MKQTSLNIMTTVSNLSEIKELLDQVATLPVDEVKIQINYLPSSDLSIK